MWFQKRPPMSLFWECNHYEPLNEEGKPGRCVGTDGIDGKGVIETYDTLSFCECAQMCQTNVMCLFFSHGAYADDTSQDEYDNYLQYQYGSQTNCVLYQNLEYIEDASAYTPEYNWKFEQTDAQGHVGCYSKYEGYFFSI